MQKLPQLLWPEIVDLESSKKAVRLAQSTAFLVAVISGVVVYLQTSGKTHLFPFIQQSAYLDVLLFFLVGIGLGFKSRIAALAGLALYVTEQGYAISQGMKFSFVAIFFTLNFISGIRGAFAYHGYKKQVKNEESSSELNPPPNTKEPPSSPLQASSTDDIAGLPDDSFLSTRTKWSFVAGVVFMVSTASAFWVVQKSAALKSEIEFQAQQETGFEVEAVPIPKYAITPPVQTKPPVKKPIVLSGPLRTFRMKDGREFEGQVLFEDDIYYSVQTTERVETILKEEIAS